MKNQSLTITSLFVSILSFLVLVLDLPIPKEGIVDLVASVGVVVSQVTAIYGRVRVGDVTITGKRKNAA